MKVDWKFLKDEWIFAISETKAGYVEWWQLFWAIIAAPVKVGIEFAKGRGRWAVHRTRDARTHQNSLGTEGFQAMNWLRNFGVGGSAYYRFFGKWFFVNNAFFALYLLLRVSSVAVHYFSSAG